MILALEPNLVKHNSWSYRDPLQIFGVGCLVSRYHDDHRRNTYPDSLRDISGWRAESFGCELGAGRCFDSFQLRWAFRDNRTFWSAFSYWPFQSKKFICLVFEPLSDTSTSARSMQDNDNFGRNGGASPGCEPAEQHQFLEVAL